jgi:MFS family permease
MPPRRRAISGSILAIGTFMALVMAPLAGALSDRIRNAKGRRRPFLIAGMAGTCVGLALLVPFGTGSSILLYALAILNLQFWWNSACGPYAGLIPDVVPAGNQASASAWMNIMSILGTFTGNGIAVALYVHGHPAAAISGLIVINIICLAITLKRVREPPASGAADPFALGPFLRSFWLPPAIHRNFYRVLVTPPLCQSRCLVDDDVPVVLFAGRGRRRGTGTGVADGSRHRCASRHSG